MSDQTPQQPGWGPPPQPSDQQPPPPQKKQRSGAFKAGFLGCFGVLAAVVLVIIVVAVIASSGSKTTTNTPAGADNAQSASTAAGSNGKPAGTVLLSITGSGTKTTQKFSAASDWDLVWAYDCSSFGSEGNFIVSVDSSDALAAASINGVNQLGSSDKGVEHYHQGGTFWLEINSECSWSVKASVA